MSPLDERVPAVAPRSTTKVVETAEEFLRFAAPGALTQPGGLDVMHLVEVALPPLGIHVYPVAASQLGDSEGCTHYANDSIEILLPESYWEALLHGGSDRNRAVSTFAHECGHAVLHRRDLQAYALLGQTAMAAATALHRRRKDLEPFMDPEWQAWTFAGAVLLPRPALASLAGFSIRDVAARFRVSLAMAERHIKRIHRLGFGTRGGALTVYR